MQVQCIKGLGLPTAGSAGRALEDQTASRREPDTLGKVNAGSERSKLRNANFGGTQHRSERTYALPSSVREAPPRGSANQRPITIARGPHCRRAGFARDPPPGPAHRSSTSIARRRAPDSARGIARSAPSTKPSASRSPRTQESAGQAIAASSISIVMRGSASPASIMVAQSKTVLPKSITTHVQFRSRVLDARSDRHVAGARSPDTPPVFGGLPRPAARGIAEGCVE